LALPAGVRGPVECFALRRLAAICLGVGTAGVLYLRVAGGVKFLGLPGVRVTAEVIGSVGVGIICVFGDRVRQGWRIRVLVIGEDETLILRPK